MTNERDEEGNNKVLCKVHSRAEPAFTEPCDARIIGAYCINSDNSRMKVLRVRSLKTKAIMVERGNSREAVFLAILYEV